MQKARLIKPSCVMCTVMSSIFDIKQHREYEVKYFISNLLMWYLSLNSKYLCFCPEQHFSPFSLIMKKKWGKKNNLHLK